MPDTTEFAALDTAVNDAREALYAAHAAVERIERAVRDHCSSLIAGEDATFEERLIASTSYGDALTVAREYGAMERHINHFAHEVRDSASHYVLSIQNLRDFLARNTDEGGS